MATGSAGVTHAVGHRRMEKKKGKESSWRFQLQATENKFGKKQRRGRKKRRRRRKRKRKKGKRWERRRGVLKLHLLSFMAFDGVRFNSS